MLDLIFSQGRIADRTSRTIEGAARTAQALERRYGTKGRSVGKAAPPALDDWRVSLPQARDTLLALGRAIETSIERGNRPLMVANTCSASLASLPVVARNHPEAVVLWVDAHGDFNTPETTDTGYLGGMVLAATCGLWNSGHGAGVRSEQVILVGARDIDPAEAELLSGARVRILSPKEATPQNVLAAIDGSPVWIHVDWDALEPGFVPADYAVPDGIFPAQLREIFSAIPAARILGVEVAEFHLPHDEEKIHEAVSIILDILAPVLEHNRG